LDVAAHGVRRCLDERLVALAEVIFGKEIIEKHRSFLSSFLKL